ncbi:unnamed protein product [Rhizoctonia solani]|uniref:Uncharacterized protein n=1 Tax=Rhizoctonia solani TaxID=456999 RepID=A0A8H3DPY9_9AGAM|nr:unnamed protein product [Rhizoctonia solani]
MTLPDAIQSRVSALEKRLSESVCKLDRLRQPEVEGFNDEEHNKVRDEEFIGVLKDTCSLVREAELANAPYLVELAKAADNIFGDAVTYSYDSVGYPGDLNHEYPSLYDFMPSWAHDDAGDRPLIKDESGGKLPISHGALDSLMQIFQLHLKEEALSNFKTEPWNASLKRHPKSTNLSRFRLNLPTLTPILSKPLAASVLDARCEISSSQTATPIRFLTSPGNTCLALTAMGGWKNRSPALDYLFPNQPLAPSVNFPTLHGFQPGLARVAFHGAIDEPRRLILVGDDDRIKSYEWGSSNGDPHEELLPVHTMNSRRFEGPMTILPNGRVIIGEEIEDFDTMRDDPEEIEQSSGSTATSQITFLDQPDLKPSLWQPLLTAPSTVVCAEYSNGGGSYSCIGIDLEVAKTTTYYLGHGAGVSDFSVSLADPQLFLTACNDGFARLYDARRPLPVVTFDACRQNEFCGGITLAHPNGVPIVFTGAHRGEQIKVWDVRARACVYELATGNNAVQSLAWDAQNNCLYAATECAYMDRLGYHHDCRYAKIPKSQMPEEFREDYEDDDDDYFEDEERCWPKLAWHKEDYFGYLYDAGDHLVLRYAFKEDPNISVVPQYGDGSIRGGYW